MSFVVSNAVLARSDFSRNDIPVSKGAAFLVSSCREVVDIYDQNGEETLLAPLRTSLAESVRAGYCLGVVVQYQSADNACLYSKRNTLEMAEAIAHSNLTEAQLEEIGVPIILERAYCGL
ncbi:hypothetical protein O1D97_08260 [Marinomonas sp. 15G1-11]|uniref:Uncharacterized protein n=1 Tax=Marinomonas phaeophyticola TaxID=3004091 RepID=A0ABT4JTC1_9GAMM|nr:hypothetical protein [Marinomonas sp. 15G1-11]MCZ2721647.1 hypothetical protein [Marinomonas sp. 15G1-11]